VAAPQHALDRRDGGLDRLAELGRQLAGERRVRGVADRAAVLAERLGVRAPAQLGERRLERDPDLERGLARTPLVEVEARAGRAPRTRAACRGG
jgi:hypothetical protein